MKKRNIIIVILIVVVILISFLYLKTKLDNNCPKNSSKNSNPAAVPHSVANVKESNIDLPEFNVVVRGLYSGNITNKDILEKGIKIYNFDASATYNWGFMFNNYIGIKLSDVLTQMNYNNYNEIVFVGNNGKLNITFKKEEITDKAFLVFYVYGEKIGNNDISYIDFGYLYNYAIEGLFEIILK